MGRVRLVAVTKCRIGSTVSSLASGRRDYVRWRMSCSFVAWDWGSWHVGSGFADSRARAGGGLVRCRPAARGEMAGRRNIDGAGAARRGCLLAAPNAVVDLFEDAGFCNRRPLASSARARRPPAGAGSAEERDGVRYAVRALRRTIRADHCRPGHEANATGTDRRHNVCRRGPRCILDPNAHFG